MQVCPSCKGSVNEDAVKCMHCGSKLNIAYVKLRKATAGAGNLSRNAIGAIGILLSIILCFVFLPIGIILFIITAVAFIGLKQKIDCPKCRAQVKVDNMLRKAYCFNCRTDIHIEWEN